MRSAFDDDLYNRKPEDINAWDVDVETSDFVITTDPSQEINEKVYEQIENKISELINNAVTFAISQSLKGAIKVNGHRY